MNIIACKRYFFLLLNEWRKIEFSQKQQRLFLEDLLFLIQDGIAPASGIDLILESAKGIRKEVAAHIQSCLSKGMSLSEGIQKWFSQSVFEIIYAGESSANLEESIKAALDLLNDSENLALNIMQKLAYPLVVFGLSLVLIVFIRKSILDTFTSIVPLNQWPDTPNHLYHFSTYIQTFGPTLVLIGFLLGYLLQNFLKQFTGSLRTQLDRLPIFSLYRDKEASHILKLLGTLLKNGVPLKRAINILQHDASPYSTWHLSLMAFNLSGGSDNIYDIMDTKLLNKSDMRRLKIIAKTRGFATALLSMGQHTQKRLQTTWLLIARIFAGILMLGAAAIAANTILAIYTLGSTLSMIS